jgi:hypothetical protein
MTPPRLPRAPRPPNGSGKHGRPTYGQAQKIIALFGGPARFADLVGVSRITAYRYGYAKPYGTDGLIPAPMVERVERAARLDGIVLLPSHWAHERIDYSTEDGQ